MTAPQHAWRDYFDSEYLVGEALPDEGRTYTISDKARVGIEDKGETKHKLVLTMTDGTKWLTNVTNCTYLERVFGEKEPAAWIGKRVTLGYDPNVKFGKDIVGGIRVIGSPELTDPVSFMFAANSRQKPRRVTLKPTGNGSAPASVDPVTGEVADSAEAQQDGTQAGRFGDAAPDGAPPPYSAEIAPESPVSGEEEEPPGRGALFDADNPARPATSKDRKALSEAVAHVDAAEVKKYRQRFDGRSNSELTHGECEEFIAWALKQVVA